MRAARWLSAAMLGVTSSLWTCAPSDAQSLRVVRSGPTGGPTSAVEELPGELDHDGESGDPNWIAREPAWDASTVVADDPVDSYGGDETHVGDAAPYDPAQSGATPYGHDAYSCVPPLRRRMVETERHLAATYNQMRAPERTQRWINRPLSIGGFVGGIWGDQLISDRVDQETGFFTGGRLGWDVADRWGIETRVGFAEINLRDPTGNTLLDKNDLFLFDADLLYYPWGEARLRPYASFGLGFHTTDFVDDNGFRVKDTLFAMPIGLGCKWRLGQRLALRIDVADQLAFAGGNDVDTTHNISLTGGLEFRFGGRKKNYWPWDPSRTWW